MTCTEITFEVPGLPVGKERCGYNSKTGKFFKKPRTRASENGIGWLARAAFGPTQPWPGAVTLQVDIYIEPARSWPIGKRAACLAQLQRPTAKPDTDNVLKTVKDALNGIVWIDDKQVCSDTVNRWYAPTSRMVITARAWVAEVSDV